MIDIETLEKEIIDFEKNIKESTELINVLKDVISQTKESGDSIAENTELVVKSIKNNEKKASTQVKTIQMEIDRFHEVSKEVVNKLDETAKSNQDQTLEISRSLEKTEAEIKQGLNDSFSEQSSKMDALLEDLKKYDNGSKAKLDEINNNVLKNDFEKVSQSIAHLEKTINSKLVVAGVGIAISILLGIIGIIF